MKNILLASCLGIEVSGEMSRLWQIRVIGWHFSYRAPLSLRVSCNVNLLTTTYSTLIYCIALLPFHLSFWLRVLLPTAYFSVYIHRRLVSLRITWLKRHCCCTSYGVVWMRANCIAVECTSYPTHALRYCNSCFALIFIKLKLLTDGLTE
jgi:hypothetical protein